MQKQALIVLIGAACILLITALIGLMSGQCAPVELYGSSVEVSASLSGSSIEVSDSLSDSGEAFASASEDRPADSSLADSEASPSQTASSGSADTQPETDPAFNQPLIHDEMRAMWISYLDFQSLTTGRDADGFQAAFTEIADNCLSIGVNTLIVQVRPFADAMYPSQLFPWSMYASGTQGVDPGYDPLAMMLDIAHARGMAVHAWCNPLRISRDGSAYLCEDNLGLQWFNEGTGRVQQVNGGLYFDPSFPEVVELICQGVREICANYPIDGIHLDDYFYPTTDTSFDSAQYFAYRHGGGEMKLEDWRRANVDTLVQSLYAACHEYGVPFGISPAGNLDYTCFSLFANVPRWLNEPGFVDYICPQIYWGFQHSSKPFAETVDSWQLLVNQPNIQFTVGLAAYKIDTEDGNTEWQKDHDLLARQVSCLRRKGCGGWALFRYGSLFQPEASVREAVSLELEALREVLAQ